jgi:ribose 5-phosphate isomerase B
MKIALGGDHTATQLKSEIKNYLERMGHQVEDIGAYSDTSTDYPIYAKEVAQRVQANTVDRGILICGTGIGMSIAANKFEGIRAAAVSEPFSARATREHNDANIICFGSRVVGSELAIMIVDEFLTTEYQGGRHQNRLDQITSFEK